MVGIGIISLLEAPPQERLVHHREDHQESGVSPDIGEGSRQPPKHGVEVALLCQSGILMT